MNRSTAVKLVVCLLVATLASAPQAFACSQCCNIYSPYVAPQILYDNYFDEECEWVYGGSASYTNGSAEIPSVGSVYQEVTIPSGYTHADLSFNLDVVPGVDDGTERLLVEVLNSGGSLLDTLDVLESGSADGRYDYQLGNYGGQTIRIRFRVVVMPDPGDTVFRIDGAFLWIY